VKVVLHSCLTLLLLTGLPVAVVQAADPAPKGPASEKAVDRLQVMSIVPWKAAEPPGGPDRPMGSLIDELLAPLDRDEFRREINYYRDLASPTASVSPVPVPGANPQ
jgi:hypothetical protein